MRLLNPPTLGFAPLPSRLGYPGHSVTLIAKALVKLRHGQPCELVRPPEPLFPGPDLPYADDEQGLAAPRYESDYAPFKPVADAMLVGHFHARGGRAVRAAEASFIVGRRALRVALLGRRVWDGTQRWPSLETAEPFSTLELRWENAYGGPGFLANPVGRGFGVAQPSAPLELPRIERPDRPFRPDAVGPDPICFSPVRRQWLPRARLLGTLDKRWQATRWPWFPEDFDWRHFQAAVPELQVPEYLAGDELLEMENLHPTVPQYQSRLPGLRAVAAVQRKVADAPGGTRFEAVPMKLDTLWVDMDAEAGCLVWRGACPTRDPDMSDLVYAWAGLDPLARGESEVEIANRARAEVAAEEAQWEIVEQAPPPAEPSRVAPPPPKIAEGPPPEVAAALAGIAAAQAPAPPPTTPEQAALIERIRAEAEAKHDAALSAPVEADDKPPPWTRERVRQVLASGGSIAGEDLSGVDLSGEDLTGAALVGTILAGARLGGAKLSAADLSQSSLAGADLSGADLSHVNLDGSDLSRSTGEKVILAGARLTNTNLAGVRWQGADLSGAMLDLAHAHRAGFAGATFRGASLAEADLRGANVDGASFEGANASGATFTGTSAVRTGFAKAVLKEADFSNANLQGATFDSADLTDANFEHASAAGLHVSDSTVKGLRAGEADLSGASFLRVSGDSPYFEGASLAGVQLVGATLPGADFSRCDLRAARLAGCTLTSAKFVRADLRGATVTGCDCFEALFEAAQLGDCDGSHSSFYGAEFLDAQVQTFHGRQRVLTKTKLAPEAT